MNLGGLSLEKACQILFNQQPFLLCEASIAAHVAEELTGMSANHSLGQTGRDRLGLIWN